ncbi:hypothetical protein GB882_05630 [Georgenia ruanii]|uniref:Uncharacterized protein n=1 Tax=Georgenia ruanii TaxID=348442 RepID=A0A7J9UUF9_9MICO|nr:hypothetical protein [Georgenia ruanii]
MRVAEHTCEVWSQDEFRTVGFAPMFPSPRVERVSPGHLVAVATGPNGADVVVWRWFDAVVLDSDGGSVRLWEPAHGEVVAQPRPSYARQVPGSRAYASAGLPGAEWWVADRVDGAPHRAGVELAQVDALYAENDLWAAVFGRAPDRVATSRPPPGHHFSAQSNTPPHNEVRAATRAPLGCANGVCETGPGHLRLRGT